MPNFVKAFLCIFIRNLDFKFYYISWVKDKKDWFSLWFNLAEVTMKKHPKSVLFGNTKKRNLSYHVFKNNFQLGFIYTSEN